MNKFLAILMALVLTGSIAYAQHTNVGTSKGNNNDIDFVQGFDGSGTAYDGNEAYADQVGNNNEIDIKQLNNGYAGSSEYAEVNQKGNNNDGIVDQYNDGHWALINSNGDNNYAKIKQEGNDNDGEFDQDGNRNEGNSFAFGILNTTYGRQLGNDNEIDQDLGNGEATEDSHLSTVQLGNRNYSRQDVEGDGYPGGIDAVRNIGDVLQRGNNNTARQIMTQFDGDVMFNELYGKQLGDNNVLKQEAAGDGNFSNIMQSGNMNNAVSLQN